MNSALQQFLSVALPIMVTLVATIWIAQWSQNKRFDDMGKRFEDLGKRFDDLKSDMNRRFDRVETKLDAHDERLVRLEDRASLLRR